MLPVLPVARSSAAGRVAPAEGGAALSAAADDGAGISRQMPAPSSPFAAISLTMKDETIPVQCQGTTRSGARCKHKTTNPDGLCGRAHPSDTTSSADAEMDHEVEVEDVVAVYAPDIDTPEKPKMASPRLQSDKEMHLTLPAGDVRRESACNLEPGDVVRDTEGNLQTIIGVREIDTELADFEGIFEVVYEVELRYESGGWTLMLADVEVELVELGTARQ